MSDEASQKQPLAREILGKSFFIDACNRAGIPATIRQARKYLAKKGAAYKASHQREV